MPRKRKPAVVERAPLNPVDEDDPELLPHEVALQKIESDYVSKVFDFMRGKADKVPTGDSFF
jgi:hypothetical protein